MTCSTPGLDQGKEPCLLHVQIEPHCPSHPSPGGLGLRSPVWQLPPFSLTLVRVGGGQDGAVFPLHLLHVFSDLVNKAADLFHLGTQVRGVKRKTGGTQRGDGPTLGTRQPLLESPKHGLCFAE